MILKLDSKHRLTIPAKLAPWKPGDWIEVTYIKSEDAFVARRIKLKTNWLRVLKKSPPPTAMPRARAKKNG
jgi:bifunctional DNA-binding transcriptional regulator/antitoxin component of YhaV-PrlF toxin-antitoxin module